MHYESNQGLEVLIELFRARDRALCGKEESSRRVLFVGSGVMRGVDGAGRGSALEEEGLLRHVHHLIGSSTGAACGQFGLSEQIRECIDLYWTSAISHEFIDLRRMFISRPVVDTHFLTNEFRRRLNLGAFRASTLEFYACATHAETGEGQFLDVRAARDHQEVIRASMSIPILSGSPVYIHDEPYLDGGVAMEFPIRAIVEKFDPTHLLVFANRAPMKEPSGIWRQVIEQAGLRRYSRQFQEVVASRRERFEEELAFLRKLSFPWMLYWGPTFSSFLRDAQKLQEWAHIAQSSMRTDLSDAQKVLLHECTTNRPLTSE